jgi:sporulation protein YlmC with PRC-barrel domain
MIKKPTIVALILAILLIIVTGCSNGTYTQTIKITIDPVNVNGLISKIGYYRDRELVNSLTFIDGDGDSIIDGKTGPSAEGNWPKGWEWFDDLYSDVVVGYSTITKVGEKIVIQNTNTHEFLPGEYECEYIG